MEKERVRTDVESLLLNEMVEDDEFLINSMVLEEAVDAIVPANTNPGLFDDASSDDELVDALDDPDIADLMSDDDDDIF
jgi:hypothetical protein